MAAAVVVVVVELDGGDSLTVFGLVAEQRGIDQSRADESSVHEVTGKDAALLAPG